MPTIDQEVLAKIKEAFEEGYYHGHASGWYEARYGGHGKTEAEELAEAWEQFQSGYRI